jgi:hypothetical protein
MTPGANVAGFQIEWRGDADGRVVVRPQQLVVSNPAELARLSETIGLAPSDLEFAGECALFLALRESRCESGLPLQTAEKVLDSCHFGPVAREIWRGFDRLAELLFPYRYEDRRLLVERAFQALSLNSRVRAV